MQYKTLLLYHSLTTTSRTLNAIDYLLLILLLAWKAGFVLRVVDKQLEGNALTITVVGRGFCFSWMANTVRINPFQLCGRGLLGWRFLLTLPWGVVVFCASCTAYISWYVALCSRSFLPNRNECVWVGLLCFGQGGQWVVSHGSRIVCQFVTY